MQSKIKYKIDSSSKPKIVFWYRNLSSDSELFNIHVIVETKIRSNRGAQNHFACEIHITKRRRKRSMHLHSFIQSVNDAMYECAPQFWFGFLCGAHNYRQHEIRTRARQFDTLRWWCGAKWELCGYCCLLLNCENVKIQ